MPAAIETPDLVIRHIGYHRREFRVLAKKMLAGKRAALGFEILVFAIDAFFHPLAQQPLVVACQQRVPARTPDDLDHIPAGAEKRRFQFLDNLAITPDRSVESLQVAVNNKYQVVQFFAHRHGNRTQRLRFIHFTVTEETPDLAVVGRDDLAVLHVTAVTGLVNRHHRAQTHRDRRELPEIRHQPWMWIRRQAVTADFAAKRPQLLLIEPSFEKSARVDAGRGMTLEKNHIAGIIVVRGTPEMIEADFIQRRR